MFGSVALLFQIMPNEIPMSKYSVVHTGPKRYAGGFHVGLFSASNHGLLFALAKSPLIIPTLSHSIIAMMNFHAVGKLFVAAIKLKFFTEFQSPINNSVCII